MNKLSKEYQKKWEDNPLFDSKIIEKIKSFGIKDHPEIKNIMSSQGACLNVLGFLAEPVNKNLLMEFIRKCGIQADDIIEIDEDYSKKLNLSYHGEGLLIFEWIGPRQSIINEGNGGGRGFQRTSTDAYVLIRLGDKIIQILIEWKFTESYLNTPNRFYGGKGLERLRRYSTLLQGYRRKKVPLLSLKDEDNWGLSDLGYEPYYQLLRMHLLGRESTSTLNVADDYLVLHLNYSENEKLNSFTCVNLADFPGLERNQGDSIYSTWEKLLSAQERIRFKHSYWNEVLKSFPKTTEWFKYIEERYL